MVICFDLDGTICKTEGMNYELAQPIRDRIEKINKLYDEGNTIYIDSARGKLTKIDWSEETVKQLEKWGVKYHLLRTGIKFYADWYIDDRALNADEFFK